MKLTAIEFEKAVKNYMTMQKQCDDLCNLMGTCESIFDEWLNYYYMLLDSCCEFEEEDYGGWNGTPLSAYLFSDHIYEDKDGNNIVLSDPLKLYNYILSMHS